MLTQRLLTRRQMLQKCALHVLPLPLSMPAAARVVHHSCTSFKAVVVVGRLASTGQLDCRTAVRQQLYLHEHSKRLQADHEALWSSQVDHAMQHYALCILTQLS